MEHGEQATLRSEYGLDVKGIVEGVLSLFPGHGSDAAAKVRGGVKSAKI